jgi:hypothetical protein
VDPLPVEHHAVEQRMDSQPRSIRSDGNQDGMSKKTMSTTLVTTAANYLAQRIGAIRSSSSSTSRLTISVS